MTVAESRRGMAAGTRRVLATDVGAALTWRILETARSARPGTLVSATAAAPDVDAVALFAAARTLGLQPSLWIQATDGLEIVGLGEAWSVVPAGPRRFGDADAAWRALTADALVDDESGETRGTGPLLVGGFAFDAGGGTAPVWAGYGGGRLALPRFTWSRTPQGTWLTANTIARPRAPGDSVAARSAARTWSGVVAAAARGRPASGSGATGSDIHGVPILRIDGGEPDAAAWRTVAGRFAGAVGRGRLDKVVLARRVDLRADAEIDVAATLRRLVGSASESTVFAVARGDAVFLGASPERLVRTDGRDARTVAIAGSARRGADTAEDDLLATALLADEKEREEHEVVVRMLRESLAPLCDELDVAASPRVIRLRTVQHLCTDVTARTSDRTGILSLVDVLHPTPAVGGQPRAVALELIRDQERLDRGWYAAPLGWLDRDGDGEFIVALRSGVVRGDRASLFAGCGIVADSEPDREWEESRMKLRALGSALGTVEL